MWMLTFFSTLQTPEQIAFETLKLLTKYVEDKSIKNFTAAWFPKGS